MITTAMLTPVSAQSHRDSAGVRIVLNDNPVWSPAEALRLGSTPARVIGSRPGGHYEFSNVRGAVLLTDGTAVVADGGSLELRYFDATGEFVRSAGRRGHGPGEFHQIEGLAALPGDTIAVFGPNAVALFTKAGTFALQLPNPPATPQPLVRALAILPGGWRFIISGAIPRPRAPGERWTDSVRMRVVDASNVTAAALGNLPAFELAMAEAPSLPWFGPVASWAASSQMFYYGFPSEYSLRAYSADGRLDHIIRRAWTPRRVTERDKDDHTDAWAQRWIRSTGDQAARERAEHRAEPYAHTVPAFSQLIVDRVGRLWVRDAHLPDAAWSGALNTLPLEPSEWSVFDSAGRWLCNVSMPARFLPQEIGRDYVLGIARDSDDVETVILYRLVGGRPHPDLR